MGKETPSMLIVLRQYGCFGENNSREEDRDRWGKSEISHGVSNKQKAKGDEEWGKLLPGGREFQAKRIAGA